MSRASIGPFLLLCLIALLVNLVRPTPSESSYTWHRAAQITDTLGAYDSDVNTALAWGEADSFEIHSVYRECASPTGCNGANGRGRYLHVTENDTSGWKAAADTAHLLTGLQGDTLQMGGQDFDFVVDSDNNVHVVFELFDHAAYDPGAGPSIGYKRTGRRSWDSDTAIVVNEPANAGRNECGGRRDHGPRLYVEHASSGDTLHLIYPLNTDDCSPDSLHHAYLGYTKKAADTPDAAWSKETFMTRAFAKYNTLESIEYKAWDSIGSGPVGLVVDDHGIVHVWGFGSIQLLSSTINTWRHFWGKPPASGDFWADSSIAVFADTIPNGAGSGAATSTDLNNGRAIALYNHNLYLVFYKDGGPAYIHRIRDGGGYAQSDTAGAIKLFTAPDARAYSNSLFRSNDGVWHHVYSQAGSTAVRGFWHRYVTTGQDPFDATPDGWSEPSNLTIDVAGGAKQGFGAPFVADSNGVWITYTADDAASGYREIFARKGDSLADTVFANEKMIWDGIVSLDRDFFVAEDGTLLVQPGTVVVAADSTDSLNAGKYPNLIEIVIQGLLQAEGDPSSPIEFRGTDTTLVSGWGGIRLDYVGAQTGYGYNNTGIMDWVTVRDAARGISIENIGAPSLSNVTFRNNDVADIYVDSTDVEIPYNGGWSLQGPTRVLVTTGTKSGHDISVGYLGEGLSSGKVDFEAYGKLTTTGDSTNMVSFLPDVASPDAGDLWGGICLDWTADGSQLEYADIGYAEFPLFFFYQDGTTPSAVRYSQIHHFADTGVWINNAGGAGVIVEENNIFRNASGQFDQTHGKTGVLVQLSNVAAVRNNTITLQGMSDNYEGGSGIESQGGKTFCSTNPASAESVVVENNNVIGPGGGQDTGLMTWSGLSGNWACGSPNRKVYFGENLIRGWNGAGFDLLQSSNVQLTCNDADSCAVGIDFSRNTEPSGVGVRFRYDSVRLADFDASDTTAALVTTDNASKLNLGPNTSTKGINWLIVKGQDRYILDSDQSADSLDAQNNFWSRNAIHHDVVDSILTYVEPDTAYVRVQNPLPGNYSPPNCSPGSAARARPGVAAMDDAGRSSAEAGAVTRLSGEAARTELISTGPNPFAWNTVVRFSVASGSVDPVRIEIYDVTGRLVRRLVDGFVEPGTYRVSWSGRDEHGSRAAAGIYFLRMRTGSYTKVQKLVSLH